MKHECPKCETIYVPYNSEIACPKCGDKPEMEDYPEFVEGICESFLYNIKEFGGFVPMCWATIDISDSFQMFLFNVFHEWVTKESSNHEPQVRTEAFKEFIDNIIEKVDLNGMDFMAGYATDLACAVYNEFFNVRNIDLEVTKEGIKVK
jgi:hypothetical protein